jgi:SAM-dependent methyltransferase
VTGPKFARYNSWQQRLRSRLASGPRLSPDSPAAAIREAVLADPYLASAYSEMYDGLRGIIPPTISGPIVELGAGADIGRSWIPSMLTTDVLANESLDAVLSAAAMPFRDSAVGAFVINDALHHFPDVDGFLDEALRCLEVGGAIVACEPYWGPLSAAIYRTFHPEPFNRRAVSWSSGSADPWDSNQALLWIMLRRDRHRLTARWPMLRIEEFGCTLGPSYLLSGGVFGRTPIPAEWLLSTWRWEQRRGRRFDPLRFKYLVRFTKVG